MKWTAVALGVIGALLGVFVAVVQHGGVLGPVTSNGGILAEITVVASAFSLIGGILSAFRPRLAMLLYLIALVVGIFGGGAMWQLPGSFIFIGLIVLLISSRGLQDI